MHDEFSSLCRQGAMVLFIYRDIGGANQEHEVGFVTREDMDKYEVMWHVLSSTSGCKGLSFIDWYRSSHSLTDETDIVNRRIGVIFETIEDNHDLQWSSMPIYR